MSRGKDQEGLSRRSILKAAAAGGAALLAPAVVPSVRAQAGGGTVHFGCSLPLTGTYEKVARIYRDGYDFWARTVNNEIMVGGKPMGVRWTVYDDENNPSRVAQLTEKLITSDKVSCIAGAYGTDTNLAQSAVAARHKFAVIQAGAASSRIDEEVGGHTTFTLVGAASSYYLAAIDYLATKTPAPKTIALVVVDDPVYHEHAVGIRERCARHNIKVVAEEMVPLNVQDFRPTALKLKNLGPVDIIAAPAWDVVCIKLVQELSTLGVQPKAFIGGHLTANPIVKQSLGPKLQDVIGVTLWAPSLKYKDPHFSSPAEFLEKFTATYGYTPTYHAAMAYAIPLTYEQALKDADPADPFNQERLKAALRALSYESVFGPIAFNAKGRIRNEGMPVLQWFGTDPVAKIVFPESMAEASGAYPKVPW
ncbi:amino acid ABC transporter substrate-binding protein [Xanthobacter sp. V3C-3]|uniref:amino acid ABC transporter substrate-binding protein n=1 Tax=Xanthobacter lutulentifluminis TaxID=3119935 RepID=UPI00372876C5